MPSGTARPGLWIAGAGGVGREALDTALAAGVPVAGFLDDHSHGATVRGLPVRRPADLGRGAPYLVGIADPAVRQRGGAPARRGGGEPGDPGPPPAAGGPPPGQGAGGQ
ncbi:hypothetical protein ABZY91_16550, partial [Kitasatospora sp. NPDC002965]